MPPAAWPTATPALRAAAASPRGSSRTACTASAFIPEGQAISRASPGLTLAQAGLPVSRSNAPRVSRLTRRPAWSSLPSAPTRTTTRPSKAAMASRSVSANSMRAGSVMASPRPGRPSSSGCRGPLPEGSSGGGGDRLVCPRRREGTGDGVDETGQIRAVAADDRLRVLLAGPGAGLLGQPGGRALRPADRGRPVGGGVPGVHASEPAQRHPPWCCRWRPSRRRSTSPTA